MGQIKMKKILLLTFAAVLMLAALSVPSYSQTVGVTVGDYFLYEPAYEETISGSGFNIPYQLSNFTFMDDVDSINRTVTAVSGTLVTFQEDWVFNNGTAPATTTLVVDLSSYANATAKSAPLIPSDAAVDDAVAYDGDWNNGDLIVNGTFTWGFPAPRECFAHTSMTTQYATVNRTFVWDQTTGILILHRVTISYTSGASGAFGTYQLLLTETSEWDIPEFPTGTVMLLMFVAVAASIEIYRRKKLNF